MRFVAVPFFAHVANSIDCTGVREGHSIQIDVPIIGQFTTPSPKAFIKRSTPVYGAESGRSATITAGRP
jgi:hypothetical protein